MVSLKRILCWFGLFFLLDYYKIFVIVLNACLSLSYYEYQSIFRKICESQTGKKEEIYISQLSGSFIPLILNQMFTLSSSLFTENPERMLCICLFISIVVLSFTRIRQYSSFCIEVTEQKRKKKKLQKSRDEDK